MLVHIRIGAERGGKNWDDIEVLDRAGFLVTDDKAVGRDIFRASFGPYYATAEDALRTFSAFTNENFSF